MNYAFIILGNEIGYDEKEKSIIVRSQNYYDQNGKKTAGYEELKEYIQHICMCVILDYVNIFHNMLIRNNINEVQ